MTCGICKHSSAWKHDFLRCFHLPKWEYVSPIANCFFTPSRHVRAA